MMMSKFPLEHDKTNMVTKKKIIRYGLVFMAIFFLWNLKQIKEKDAKLLIAEKNQVVAYWGVEDIKKTYDKLMGLGAIAHEEPHNVGGEISVASVKDPWGNIIGIIYNPHFKLP